MIFVYGRTRLPRSTFDIYKPIATSTVTIYSGRLDKMNVSTSSDIYRDKIERRYLKMTGHRAGRKGTTLRDHRS
jgi:hypothetical protein